MKPCKNEEVLDYKLLCFNGKVKFIAIYGNRFTGLLTEDYYTTDWKHLQILNSNTAGDIYKKPKCLDEMMSIAEKLSIGIPVLRVDFNIWNDMLGVGELTFFHHGGFLPFFDEWEETLGNWIQLPKKRRR